jgi:DNA-binding NarL/FixJ family response regulator
VTRVVIADDHELIRSSLIAVLEDDVGIKVVADVATASDAIDAVVEFSPDVVLLDIQMPGLDCFHAADEIRRINPATRIVILSGDYNDRYIESALRVDARAYVTKNDDVGNVIKAIHAVTKGKRYFSPTVRERLDVCGRGDVKPRTDLLTDREWDALEYLAKGFSKKEIASFLHISVKTVEKHTQSIMDKLDLHDRVRLSLWYVDYLQKKDLND